MTPALRGFCVETRLWFRSISAVQYGKGTTKQGALLYVVIEPKLWRRLKTADSERVVPLVGEALWAAQRAIDASHTGHLFPSYCDGQNTKANSASAALNKWLKVHVSRDVVVHSLRHAMRDRLRTVECPADIIDQIGGWSRKGVGESYGRGYQVEQLHRWLARAVG
jgi:integrase